MKRILGLLASLVVLTVAEPPPPSFSSTLLGLDLSSVGLSSSYGAPPESSYGAPAPAPQQEYGAPPPQQEYGAPPPQQEYGAPPPKKQEYGAPPPQKEYGAPAPAPQPQYGPPQATVYRHIYIHSAPDEVSYPESKVIRVGGAPEKHVNIVFVKAPSASSQQQTEVILPEQPQQKTLVYVLVKKAEAPTNNIRVSGPAPTKPPKPEVYFIRYKNNEGGYGAPAPAPQQQYGPPPSSSYGAP